MSALLGIWVAGSAVWLGLAGVTAVPVRREQVRPDAFARFLALGDSYTIGERVDSSDRWPVRLVRMLRASGVDIAEPEIVARTGWTTEDLAAGVAAAGPRGPFQLVTLLVGVNDQFRGHAPERYRGSFRALLVEAIALAGGMPQRVVVLSIPDWGVTPFAEGRDRRRIAASIDQFNAINHDEAVRGGARYVDVAAASREIAEGWVASDGLHPSAGQYRRWTELTIDAARGALRR